MRLVQLAALLLSAAATAPVLAQGCTGTPLTVAQINALVTGNTVCGRPGPGYPGSASDRFQEAHVGGGDLVDYKLGAGHPVDPREKVGTWEARAGASRDDPSTIVHRYSPTVGFTWVMFGPVTNTPGSSVYSFCTAGLAKVEHVRAYIIGGTTSACGSYP